MPITIAQIRATQDPEQVVTETLKEAKGRGEGLSRKDILKIGFGYRPEDMVGNFQRWNKDLTPTPSNMYMKVTSILKRLLGQGMVRTLRIGHSRWYYWV